MRELEAAPSRHPGVTFVWLTAITFALSIWLTPSTPYWRDAPEFILQSFYLDIAHPPGYPLFAQLSNLFALLPLGPIGFRVNAFSTAMAVLNILLVALIALLVLRKEGTFAKQYTLPLICSLLILGGSSAYLRQAFSAEVYILNSVILLGETLLIWRFAATGDLRWLIILAFIAALSLGNHPSAALTYLPFLIFLIVYYRSHLSRVLVPAFIFGLNGLLVYLYLPTRSHPNLSLNTGAPNTVSRFVVHVTDRRDALLRPTSHASDLEVISSGAILKWDGGTIFKDIDKVAGQVTYFTLFVCLIGVIFTLRRSLPLAVALVCVATGNWLFFRGWDPDPWIPLLSTITIFAIVGGLGLITNLNRTSHRTILSFSFLAIIFLATSTHHARSYSGVPVTLKAREVAEEILRHPIFGSPLLSEASWFLLKYMRDIEGYRTDIPIVYHPNILFAETFTPLSLELPDGGLFQSSERREGLDIAHIDELKRFIDSISPLTPIYYEPSILTNQFLKHVVTLNQEGSIFLERGRLTQVHPDFSLVTHTRLKNALLGPLMTFSDASHYVQVVANGIADLLIATGHANQAVDLYQAICHGTPPTAQCGVETLNNLGVALLNQERYHEAAEIFRSLLPQHGTRGKTIDLNLKLTEMKLLSEKGQK